MTPEENKIYVAGFNQGYDVATNDWINGIIGWLLEQDHPNIKEAMYEIVARIEHSGETGFDEAGRNVITPPIEYTDDKCAKCGHSSKYHCVSAYGCTFRITTDNNITDCGCREFIPMECVECKTAH